MKLIRNSCRLEEVLLWLFNVKTFQIEESLPKTYSTLFLEMSVPEIAAKSSLSAFDI